MSSMPWVKMYIDFLDDPKIGRLSDRQKLRFMQLILIAGECDMDGLLVNGDTALKTEDIAWRIRADDKQVFDDIAALHDAGLVDIGEAINVVNFSKRQGRSQEERRAQWRESKRRARGSPSDVQSDVQQESNESPIGVQPLEESRGEKSRGEKSRGERGASAPARALPADLPKSAPPRKARKKAEDPNRDNAAVKVYFEKFNRWPSAAGTQMIAELVQDVPRWREICNLWAANEYDYKRITNMVDRYQRPDRPTPGSNGKHEPNEPKGFAGIREAARRKGIHIEGFTDGDV